MQAFKPSLGKHSLFIYTLNYRSQDVHKSEKNTRKGITVSRRLQPCSVAMVPKTLALDTELKNLHKSDYHHASVIVRSAADNVRVSNARISNCPLNKFELLIGS